MDRASLRSLALGVAGALLLGLIGHAAGAGAAARVRVTAALPTTGQAGSRLVVRGRVAHAPAGAVARLERQAGGAGRWVVLASATVRSGALALRWTPRSAGFLTIRVAVVRRHASLAATAPGQLLVGAAPVYCAQPATAAPPAGEGLIVGGVYNEGGPAPGIYVCQGQANVVKVTDAAGTTVTTQQVPAGGSYVFAVPPGTYDLSAGFCRGSATVAAGRATHADTVCPVP